MCIRLQEVLQRLIFFFFLLFYDLCVQNALQFLRLVKNRTGKNILLCVFFSVIHLLRE